VYAAHWRDFLDKSVVPSDGAQGTGKHSSTRRKARTAPFPTGRRRRWWRRRQHARPDDSVALSAIGSAQTLWVAENTTLDAVALANFLSVVLNSWRIVLRGGSQPSERMQVDVSVTGQSGPERLVAVYQDEVVVVVALPASELGLSATVASLPQCRRLALWLNFLKRTGVPTKSLF